MNQSDLRVIRSRKLMKDAYIDLMEEIGYKRITIKALSEKAMINRKTFYNHYDSIEDLLTDILQTTIDCLLVGLMNDDPNYYLNPSDELYGRIKVFLHNLSENKRLIRIIYCNGSNHDLITKLGDLFLQDIFEKVNSQKLLQKKNSHIPADLLSIKITTLFMAVIHWYAESKITYSEDDTAQIVLELIS